MSTIEIISGVLLALCCVLLIVVVTLQEPAGGGLAGLMGGGGGDSFFSKNKSRSKAARLALITKVTTGIVVAITIVVNVLNIWF